MKTNMTEKDKRLLFILTVGVIIVAIGYWGVRPQLKKYIELETKIAQQEEEKSINQLKIANAANIEMQADDYEQRIAEQKDEFYQVMNSSEIDRMMTQMAIDEKLEVYDLQFSIPEIPSGREAYQYSELYGRQQQLKEEYLAAEEADVSADTTMTQLSEDGTVDKSSDKKDDKSKKTTGSSQKQQVMNEVMGGEEGGYQPNTEIYAVPVTMTVGGDIANLNRFIDKIVTNDKRILFVGYSWGEFREIVRRDAEGNIIGKDTTVVETTDSGDEGVSAEELTDSKLEVVIRKSLTVRLEIYMCDTTDVASDGDAGMGVDNGEEEVTE